MFCFQCEQTAGGKGCTGKIGVCGKQEQTAALQDRLTGALISLAMTAQNHSPGPAIHRLIIESLFTSGTNVNFNNALFEGRIAEIRREQADLDPAALQGEVFDMTRLWNAPEDIRSLKSLVLFGVRGLAAYAYHAAVLGYTDAGVNAFFYKALAAIGNEGYGMDELLPVVMETGKLNLTAMELLDKANTETYGSPKPTTVPLGIEKGPFIVVSGHDLHDLKLLLEQTMGKGINIYTHGEMLPAHAYPMLKAYPHLKGHYGTAWHNQQKEFAHIPAPILFNTNCLMPVQESYGDRVFTTALTAYPGMVHIDEHGGNKDFTPIINRALALGGYAEAHPMTGINGGKEVTTGFAHEALLAVGDTIINAVKSGAIKHFFLVGGCDGAKPVRQYYTDFVKQTPKDTLVLTLACGKYRFNDLNLGELGDFPRIIDMGQCNDAYSAIKVALVLTEAFGCTVNELPLTLVLSWYEQKAVAILLTLLYLGIKNILLGPSIPAFVSPGVLNYLVEHFAIAPTSTPEQDLAKIMRGDSRV
jgi:hydroxylamine reductase